MAVDGLLNVVVIYSNMVYMCASMYATIIVSSVAYEKPNMVHPFIIAYNTRRTPCENEKSDGALENAHRNTEDERENTEELN